MTLSVLHNHAAQCFEAIVDGHRCVVDYVLRDSVMTITHTGVPDAVGGRGIAAELTKFVLDAVTEAGWKLIPACSYTAAYVRRHPEYGKLLNKA
jgi:predicted GNAT family acetyltransferase